MIILVTGLAGSGKTDTCYAVLALNYFSRITFIESDWFGAKIPFDWTGKSDIESVYQTLSLLIDYNVKRGEENFIISLCMPLLRYYSDFIEYFNKGMPLQLFCLKCEKNEVIRRIHERGRNPEQKQRELDAVDSDSEYLDKFISHNSLSFEINNTQMSEDQVAAKMIEIIKKEQADTHERRGK
jgi:broad-specificity NMP kinase